jgi:translation initiation factor 4G
VIELRARHWQARTNIAHPSTFAALHAQNRRDEATSRNAVQRGGSRRGERRGDHGQQADGWNVVGGISAARPPAKAGDLSQFGKISKPAGALSFGPTSVFSKKEPKQRDAGVSRSNSSVHMFAALGAAGRDSPPLIRPVAARGGASSRNQSIDLAPGGAPSVESGSALQRLNLLLGKKQAKTAKPTFATPAQMSEADAQKKVEEDIKVRPSVTWTDARD